jgi:hypothetical protein
MRMPRHIAQTVTNGGARTMMVVNGSLLLLLLRRRLATLASRDMLMRSLVAVAIIPS